MRKNRKIEKNRGDAEKFKTVVFIQHTPHSELAQRIRRRLGELEKVGKTKIKLVERAGTKLVDLLHKSDPWGKVDCKRENCEPCSITS